MYYTVIDTANDAVVIDAYDSDPRENPKLRPVMSTTVPLEVMEFYVWSVPNECRERIDQNCRDGKYDNIFNQGNFVY